MSCFLESLIYEINRNYLCSVSLGDYGHIFQNWNQKGKTCVAKFGVCREGFFSMNVLMEESESPTKVIDLASRCQSSATECVPEPKFYS